MKPEHVLIAIPCLLLGGTEFQTLNLAHALIEGGYAVTVCCYFERAPELVDLFRALGAEVVLLSPDGVRPASYLARIARIARGLRIEIRRLHPAVVHVQYLDPGSVPILLGKLLGARRILATAHMPGHIYGRKAMATRFLARWITDAFLCVSLSAERAFFKGDAALFDLPALKAGRRHFTLYNAVDVREIRNASGCGESVRAQYRIPTDAPVIGAVSRLSREKGIDILLEAFSEVVRREPRARLLLVGDGAERPALAAQARALGIDRGVCWAGRLPREQTYRHYQAMDLVVVPSRFEGFGLTAAEAMAAGCAVIASEVDGLSEVLGRDGCGRLFPPGDAAALSRLLLDVLADPQRPAMVRAAEERVQQLFSFERFKQEILRLYQSIV